MATTSFGVNHPLAVKAWSKKLYHEAIKQTWFGKFFGSGSNSLIQVHDDLKKGPGDRIRVGLRMLLTGDGIQGDNTLEGNEEALTLYNCDVTINQLRHAVKTGGRMSDQRVPYDLRQEAMSGLADWWAERLETWAANQLTGNAGQTDTRYTGNNSTTAPDSDHWLFADSQSSEASLSATTSYQFSLTLIDKCVAKARTLTPRIRPLRISGDEMFVMFLHPWQVYQMRTNTNTGQWLDIQKAAMAGMRSSNSPIFDGALGVYNGVVLHECPYLPSFNAGDIADSSIRRAVFCGAQAAIFATGREGGNSERMEWVEEKFDFGNQLGVAAGMIAGMVKTRFNSTDFSTIVVSTWSPTQS